MAFEKKIFSSILSLVLITGLLPCPAFADTTNVGNEAKTEDPSSQNSAFSDDGIASKPDPSETDVNDKTSGNMDGYEGSDIAAMDDGDTILTPNFPSLTTAMASLQYGQMGLTVPPILRIYTRQIPTRSNSTQMVPAFPP